MRIAILSTPRSGTTWLRQLLRCIYEIPDIDINNPVEVAWESLPQDLVYAFHWHPTPEFLTRLEQYGFQPVVLARHPLDVLISILQFLLHSTPFVSKMHLDGEVGEEHSIFGAMPCSASFMDYATSEKAKMLLAVSWQWWKQPNCQRVRYEDLVADPQAVLIRLAEAFGRETKRPIAESIASTTIPKLRLLYPVTAYHFWQGQPGLWKQLLPAENASRIAAAHQDLFSDLGYQCDPHPNLTPSQADANWTRLIWWELAEDLRNAKRLKKESCEVREQLAVSRKRIQDLEAQLTHERELMAASQLGPLTLKIAYGIRAISVRFPKTASLVKRMFWQQLNGSDSAKKIASPRYLTPVL